jgi:hypothetical protein
VAYTLRWRAVDARDYHIPTGAPADDGRPGYSGLVAMCPHDRVGPPVIGSGFAPTERHIIPEFITADLADLPLPAGASLVAFTGDGTEVPLYTYVPEQRGWSRVFGPQWRHLLTGVDAPAERELFTVEPSPNCFVGRYDDGELYEAVADPPLEFRLRNGAPVAECLRRTVYGAWRGETCTLVRAEGDWIRVRLCRPDGENVTRLGARCVERGVYEAWAPAREVARARTVDVPYA